MVVFGVRRTVSLKKSCDRCVRRRRSCDGRGLRRCSYCAARGVQECHYSIRSFPGMSSSIITTVVPASGEVRELSLPAGLSYWAADEGAGED
ncbi:unnamed protein product, partial [Ectocarpus sp. 6 AP-2014]